VTKIVSREFRLASRPNGMPTPDNFTLQSVELPPLLDGQVLVRNLFISVDPYMRGRMNAGKSYVPPFEIGEPLTGGALGEVVESRAEGFRPGDIVNSFFGWREYFIAPPKALYLVDREIQPLSAYLGVLGITGMTAWVGLNLVEVKTGDVVFVSGAAGAVGSVAGQLAKIRGCRVIGAAGSAEKVRLLREDFGFDAAFDYHEAPVRDQLRIAAPDGIDVYFDNVGGYMLEAAIDTLNVRGRIAACGSISGYNDATPRPGPTNLHKIVSKRLTIRGFIISDWLAERPAFEKEVGGYYKSGKLRHEETVIQGIENAVEAFLGLFSGRNNGKMIVKA
jgi:NADPH-dependent curcumin reductase CurA